MGPGLRRDDVVVLVSPARHVRLAFTGTTHLYREVKNRAIRLNSPRFCG